MDIVEELRLEEKKGDLRRKQNNNSSKKPSIEPNHEKSLEIFFSQKMNYMDDFFNHLLEGVILLDKNGQVLYANQRMAELIGYDDSTELREKTLFDLVHPDDKRNILKNQVLLKKTKRGHPVAYRALTKDGLVRWMEGIGSTIEIGNDYANLIFIRDVTDRKSMEDQLIKKNEELQLTISQLKQKESQLRDLANELDEKLIKGQKEVINTLKKHDDTEERLKRKEFRFRQLFEGIQDAIYVIDFNGKILETNNTGFNRLGYQKEELLNKSIADIDAPEYQKQGFDAVNSLRNQDTIFFETFHVTKTGRQIPVEVIARVFEENDEKFILAVARDISERKSVEERLRQNEIKFRAFFENSALGTSIAVDAGAPCIVNQRFADMVGYSRKELQEMPTKDMIKLVTHPDDFKDEMKFYEEIRAGKRTEYRMEKRYVTKSGEMIHADVSTKVLFNQETNDFLAFTIMLDITEKKQIQKTLKENEEKLKSMVSNIPGVFYRCRNDTDWTMQYISDEIERITGFPKTDFIDNIVRSYASIIHPDDQGLVDESIKSALEKKQQFKIRYRIIDDSDSIKWVFERGRGVFDGEGVLQWIDGIILDITQQQKMEERISRANDILSRSPLVSFVWLNVEGWPVDFVSDNVEKIFGYSKEDFLSGTVNYGDLIYEEDFSRVGEEVQRYLSDTSLLEFSQQYRIRSKNGIVRWIEDKTIIRRNEDGDATHLEGIVYEITDRKNAEDLLKENEKKYRSIFEQSNDAILIHGLNGKIFDVNDRACQLLGYSKDQLREMSLDQIHPVSCLEKSKSAIEQIRNKGHIRFDVQLKRKDSSAIDVEISSTIVDSNKGIVQGMVRDISKRKEYEQKILEKNKQLETSSKRLEYLTRDMEKTLTELDQIFNNGSTAMVVLNNDYRILRLNDTYANIFDVDKSRSLGKRCSEVFNLNFCSDTCSPENCSIRNALSDRKNVEFEERIDHEDGSYSLYQVSASKYYGMDQNIQGIILSYSDITQIRKDQERLQKMNEELLEAREETEDYVALLEEKTAALELTNEKLYNSEEKIRKQNTKLQKLDELKSNFLNVTSHELRTPMSSIKGYVQMMMNKVLGDISDEQGKALNVILRNTNRLDNLIQDILDISRLESGTMKFITEQTIIREMIGEIKETMYSACKEKNIELQVHCSDDVPLLVIDKDRIKQVIMNLVNNAIKFSPEHTIITIHGFLRGNETIIEVKDEGRGIPKDKQLHVFETFYQVDSGMDRKFGGAGLGLAISRGIVMAHGGNIWVESSGVNGEGTTFSFSLPNESVNDIEERFKQIDVFKIGKYNVEKELRKE